MLSLLITLFCLRIIIARGALCYVLKCANDIHSKCTLFLSLACLAEIRSWWEVPCIAHFCYIFRKPFKLPEFEIEVCVCVCVYLCPLFLSVRGCRHIMCCYVCMCMCV